MSNRIHTNPGARDALAEARACCINEAQAAALRVHDRVLDELRAGVCRRAEGLACASAGFLDCAPEHRAQLDGWLRAPVPLPAGAAVPWCPVQPGALAEAIGLQYYRRVVPAAPVPRPDWVVRAQRAWLLGADAAAQFSPWLFQLDDADRWALINAGAGELHRLAAAGTLTLVFAPQTPVEQLATIARTTFALDGAA